jgi:transposase
MGDPIKFLQTHDRGHSVTILGAVSNQEPVRLFYNTSQSTNKESVLLFLQQLASEIQMTGAVIVLDNHKAHSSLIVRNFCQQHQVELLFLPVGTSEYNAIEYVWRFFK